MTNAQNSFQQLLLNKDWLANFQAPTTEAIYDHKNERSAPLNKYLFTKEIPEYVQQEIADVIENLESKIHEVASNLKELETNLENAYKAYNEFDGHNKIKKIDLEIYNEKSFIRNRKTLNQNLFPKDEPIFYSFLSIENFENYKKTFDNKSFYNHLYLNHDEYEDFEIIMKLLEERFKEGMFSYIEQKQELKKKVYEPWDKIENDKYNFFNEVRKRTKKEVVSDKNINDFLSKIESLAWKTINKFIEEYSYEIRMSNCFDSKIDINYLISQLKSAYKYVLYHDFYLKYEIRNERSEYGWGTSFKLYDNKYINNERVSESLYDNKYINDFQNRLLTSTLNVIRKEYKNYDHGVQGVIIVNKVLDFFEDNMSMDKCVGQSNSMYLFLQNFKFLKEEMIKKYDESFFEKEQPPIPLEMVNGLVNLNYSAKDIDKRVHNNSLMYKVFTNMKERDFLDKNTAKSNILFINYDEQLKILKPLQNLTSELGFSKLIEELELKKSEIATTHNKLVGNIKTTDEKRENELKQYLELTQNLKKEKIENYSSKNKIDEEKFFTVLSTIVDLIKNQENKDKIIDLSKSDENQANLERFFQSFKNSYKDVFFENYFQSIERPNAK